MGLTIAAVRATAATAAEVVQLKGSQDSRACPAEPHTARSPKGVTGMGPAPGATPFKVSLLHSNETDAIGAHDAQNHCRPETRAPELVCPAGRCSSATRCEQTPE